MENRTRPLELTALSVNLNTIPGRLAECAARAKVTTHSSELDLVLYELVAIHLFLLGTKVWFRSCPGVRLCLRRREQEIVGLMLQAESQIRALVPRLNHLNSQERQERREYATAKLHA